MIEAQTLIIVTIQSKITNHHQSSSRLIWDLFECTPHSAWRTGCTKHNAQKGSLDTLGLKIFKVRRQLKNQKLEGRDSNASAEEDPLRAMRRTASCGPQKKAGRNTIHWFWFLAGTGN